MKKEWQKLKIEVVETEDVEAKLKVLAYSGEGCGGFTCLWESSCPYHYCGSLKHN